MTEDALYSTRAQEIADDPGIDDGTAIRQLLSIVVDILENIMVSGWDQADALQLRTTKKTDA